jgi:hypothetical protein
VDAGVAAHPAGRELRCLGFQLRRIEPHRLELYDLAADPRQQVDLGRRQPDAMRTLLRQLASVRFSPRFGAQRAPVDADNVERLRALGYVR